MENCFNEDEPVKLHEELKGSDALKRINYLAIQGGGGKGITYLGPIDVLTDEGLLPLKLPIEQNLRKTAGHNKGIVGISGTSAGAITAYLLALGLTADQIRNESGLIPPKKKPVENFNDPGFGPDDFDPSIFAEPEYEAGENVDGFNFEHFLTKDPPENGYRRAVIFDKNTRRNKMVKTVDGVVDKLSGKRKNKKKVANEEYQEAIFFGLDPGNAKKVLKAQTKKENKKERKTKIFPAHYFGNKAQLKEYADTIIKTREDEMKLIDLMLNLATKRRKLKKQNSAILRTIFDSHSSRNGYVYNILYDQGLFPGFAIQDYFVDVTFRRLPVTLGWDEETIKKNRFDTKQGAEEMTFREYYEWTGLDLVIAGLNVNNGNQRNFRVDCTPDFPVVAAVMMSMNIPGIFKPVYVDAEIDLGPSRDAEIRREFQGNWIDAGLANNIPFHVFDEQASRAGGLSRNRVNHFLLGLAVIEGDDPEVFSEYYWKTDKSGHRPDPFFQTYEEENGERLYEKYTNAVMTYEDDPDYPKYNFLEFMAKEEAKRNGDAAVEFKGVPRIHGGLFDMTLPPLLGWLLGTALKNATENQVREPGAKARLVKVYSYHIGTTDFKPDENLTKFVVQRAAEKTRRDLGLKARE